MSKEEIRMKKVLVLAVTLVMIISLVHAAVIRIYRQAGLRLQFLTDLKSSRMYLKAFRSIGLQKTVQTSICQRQIRIHR